MDSILTDISGIKQNLNDFLESSLNNLDKRSTWIHRELDKIREEYTNIIEKGKILLYLVNDYLDNLDPALLRREKSPGSTTSPSTKFFNATVYDPSKSNSNNTLPIMQRSKTPTSKNMKKIESMGSKSIDLDKSSSSINDNRKNSYMVKYLKSKDKVNKLSDEYGTRSDNKKETSKSSFDFKNEIKRELDKKLQFKKDQTANKIISSSPLHLRKEVSPKKNILSPLDLKRDLSPKKNFTELIIDLSPTSETPQNAPQNELEKENKFTAFQREIRVPDNRKFSILDIPAFYPDKSKVELKNKNKAYFLLANSEY
jgi:hypothetical protein